MGISESYYLPIDEKKQKAKMFYKEAYEIFDRKGLTLQSFGDPKIIGFDLDLDNPLIFPSNTFLVIDNEEHYRVNIKGGNFREGSRVYLNVEHTDRLPKDITRLIEKFDLKKENDALNF